jgi:hypothetical protein
VTAEDAGVAGIFGGKALFVKGDAAGGTDVDAGAVFLA